MTSQLSQFLEDHPPSFIEEPPDRVKCIICKKVLVEAMQSICGCKGCEKCMINYLKDGEKPCPSNDADCADTTLSLDRDIHKDTATSREILGLKVHCPSASCTVIDTIRNMLPHLEVCAFREVTCDHCAQRYPYQEKTQHDRNECAQRQVSCPHCQESMAFSRLHGAHLDIDNEGLCSRYRADCPNNCGAKDVTVKKHLPKCTNKRTHCPFHPLKCAAGKIPEARLKSHLQREAISHAIVVVAEVVELQEGSKTLTRAAARFRCLLEEQVHIAARLTGSQADVDKVVADRLKSLPPIDSNIVHRHGTFIWKIPHFSALSTEALTSEPFYSAEFGYKMCMKVHPAGDGAGRNRCLSVFFLLLRGSFDGILSWPFNREIAVTLVNLEAVGVRDHRCTVVPDGNLQVYQRPLGDANVAAGFPQFIALSKLLPPSAYCKNDTIFLKMSVDSAVPVKGRAGTL